MSETPRLDALLREEATCKTYTAEVEALARKLFVVSINKNSYQRGLAAECWEIARAFYAAGAEK